MLSLVNLVSLVGVSLLVGAVHASDYVKANHSGTLPIIISASHGGTLKPSSMPDRQNGCYDSTTQTCIYSHDCTQSRNNPKCEIRTSSDYKTADVADKVYAKITELLNASPKIVTCLVHRSKLDPNREKAEAAQGNATAESAYDEFHDALAAAKASINGSGLYILIDIHGQAKHDWTMLGYLISKSELSKTDTQLEDYLNASSIRNLASISSLSFAELLRGDTSLGTMLTEEGEEAVPSEDKPNPASGDSYYSGGYITKTYGSRDGGEVDAIQVEIYKTDRSPLTNRKDYSEKLAQTIVDFYNEHYA